MPLKETHIFAGNNTAKGFYSFFGSVFDPEEESRIYILKGGPGVGKSTFMKKFGIRMAEKGYAVEYIHCSSDEESLDGVRIPALKVAFVDGTAPHTLDPVLPGVADEIVNLGAYIASNKLEPHKEEVVRINKSKAETYKSAYRYLGAAGLLFEEMNAIYDRFADPGKFSLLCKKAADEIFPAGGTAQSANGKRKSFFSESYTANGYVRYTDFLARDKKVWAVFGENANYVSKFLEYLASEAMERGYAVHCCHLPLNPEKLQHLLIPELNVLIRSAERQPAGSFDAAVDMHGILDGKGFNEWIPEVENILRVYDALLAMAFEKLSETKKQHLRLETLYVNSMDFEGVNRCFENILSRYQ